ncbi:hypothetical protein [Henriciella aquimarina]|uniref:hypothetical protein n=1 Tax=Henriciella aquimarina TaxID=545261 RepID=UPI000A0688E6|nr:hypothetical protein [Henriciella aquimarina]
MIGDAAEVDFGKLRIVMGLSVLAGGLVLLFAFWQLGQFRGVQIGWAVMAFAFGAIAWSAVFYFGCLAVAGSLTGYIVSDDTEIKGDNVEMVTKTRSSGNARLDAWIDKFVFARNTFGLSVLPLLLLLSVYLWG